MSNITEFFSEQANERIQPSSSLPVKKKRKAVYLTKATKPMPSSPIDADAIRLEQTTRPLHKRQRKAILGIETNEHLPSSPIQENLRQSPSEDHLVGAQENGGHNSNENQRLYAPVSNNVGHLPSAPRSIVADIADDDSHTLVEPHREDAVIIGKIQYLWRMRQRWHKAEKSLILQGKALCRSIVGGDKGEASDLFDKAAAGKEVEESTMLALAPFLMSIEHFSQSRSKYEKELAKLARKLPAYDWVKSIHGLGDGGYASIIGECGDIYNYKSVSALWKRMGLAVFEGIRQRKMSNADDALLHGYNPSRRSVMWNVGNGLIGGMGRGKRPAPGEDISTKDWTDYQKLFVERCRYECTNNPEKMPLATVQKDGEDRESYPKHAQARAKRYVEKRFLRELYSRWGQEKTETQVPRSPPTN